MASAALMEPTSNHGMEDFASLLEEQLGTETGFEGSVVTGRVVRLTDEYAIVDVGLKSEGRVALKEFGLPGQKSEVKPGDNIELYVERYEDRDGSIVLSREKGGPAGIGPNLYGVVGGPHDHMPGFSYSDAMEKTANAKWGFDELNAWLTSPKSYVPGTKMAFAGIAKPEDRAAVIAYLNSKSDHPLPLPPVPAETAAPAAAAPATVASAADTAATPAGKTTSPAAVATSEKLPPQAGKAPDVDPATTTPAAVDTTKGGKH